MYQRGVHVSRVQLALNVPDIDAAVDHYTKLFATEPNKRKPGYANFAIDNPPLKLVLFENPGAESRLNHLGVEVMSTDEVAEHQARLTAGGLDDRRRERHVLLRQAGKGVGRRSRRCRGRSTRCSKTATTSGHRRAMSRGDDSLCCASVPESEARCCS